MSCPCGQSSMPTTEGGPAAPPTCLGGQQRGWVPSVCDLGGAVSVTTGGVVRACEGVQGEGVQAGVGLGPAVWTLGFGLGWVWGGWPWTLGGKVLGHTRGPESPRNLGAGPMGSAKATGNGEGGPIAGPARPSGHGPPWTLCPHTASPAWKSGRLVVGRTGPRVEEASLGGPGDTRHLSGDHSQAEGRWVRDAEMEGAWLPRRRRAGQTPIPPPLRASGAGPSLEVEEGRRGRGKGMGSGGAPGSVLDGRGPGCARRPRVNKVAFMGPQGAARSRGGPRACGPPRPPPPAPGRAPAPGPRCRLAAAGRAPARGPRYRLAAAGRAPARGPRCRLAAAARCPRPRAPRPVRCRGRGRGSGRAPARSAAPPACARPACLRRGAGTRGMRPRWWSAGGGGGGGAPGAARRPSPRCAGARSGAARAGAASAGCTGSSGRSPAPGLWGRGALGGRNPVSPASPLRGWGTGFGGRGGGGGREGRSPR